MDWMFFIVAPFLLIGLSWIFGHVLMVIAAVSPSQSISGLYGSGSPDSKFINKMIKRGAIGAIVTAIILFPIVLIVGK